jgi:hypothetical protein
LFNVWKYFIWGNNFPSISQSTEGSFLIVAANSSGGYEYTRRMVGKLTNSELETMWKERAWPALPFNSGTCLNLLRMNTINLSKVIGDITWKMYA